MKTAVNKQGIKLQVNGATGYVDYPTKIEPMLPTGFTLQSNGNIETPNERSMRVTTKQKQEIKPRQKIAHPEHLLPIGITLED